MLQIRAQSEAGAKTNRFLMDLRRHADRISMTTALHNALLMPKWPKYRKMCVCVCVCVHVVCVTVIVLSLVSLRPSINVG